jgi:hypothetical protein
LFWLHTWLPGQSVSVLHAAGAAPAGSSQVPLTHTLVPAQSLSFAQRVTLNLGAADDSAVAANTTNPIAIINQCGRVLEVISKPPSILDASAPHAARIAESSHKNGAPAAPIAWFFSAADRRL